MSETNKHAPEIEKKFNARSGFLGTRLGSKQGAKEEKMEKKKKRKKSSREVN